VSPVLIFSALAKADRSTTGIDCLSLAGWRLGVESLGLGISRRSIDSFWDAMGPLPQAGVGPAGGAELHGFLRWLKAGRGEGAVAEEYARGAAHLPATVPRIGAMEMESASRVLAAVARRHFGGAECFFLWLLEQLDGVPFSFSSASACCQVLCAAAQGVPARGWCTLLTPATTPTPTPTQPPSPIPCISYSGRRKRRPPIAHRLAALRWIRGWGCCRWSKVWRQMVMRLRLSRPGQLCVRMLPL
jgi:hypothetical protein